jgi:hypothetical protein
MSDTPDANASPVNPLFTDPGPQPQVPGVPRSVYERMVNPTKQDQQAGARLATLTRAELDRIMQHWGQTMEFLAAQRNDIKVTRRSTATKWTVEVELIGSNIPSPVDLP